jgi:hypothetical protein
MGKIRGDLYKKLYSNPFENQGQFCEVFVTN